jgi:amidase
MSILRDAARAFMPYPDAAVPHAEAGPLAGLTFAVKDLFDVAGYPTSGGQPFVLAMSGLKTATAPTVQRLLDAGARFVGKTITDELAFSMNGQNAHFGSPVNGAAPERITGGSSSGSASAVSNGLCDFALGSDTGGSVRAPANHCALVGLRPTHGRISLERVLDLAPSFDTCGWFTRGAALLAGVGDALLPGGQNAIDGPLLRVEEAWVNAQPDVAEALRPALEKLEQLRGRAVGVRIAPEGIDSIFDHFRTVQAEEAWATLGGWVEATQPRLGPGVRERFAAARATDPAIAAPGRAFRRLFQARIRPLLAGGGLFVYPTSPCPAPLLTATLPEQDAVRQATIGVTAIAGFCGLPEVTLPAATVNGAPIGLSLVAGPGFDRGLLAFACDAASVLGLAV